MAKCHEKLMVHRGSTMPVRALANSTYADSVAAYEKAKRDGVMPVTVSSIDRVVRAAILAGEGRAEPIARGFEILASVGQPSFTRSSVVYDLSAREVHFRDEVPRAPRRSCHCERSDRADIPIQSHRGCSGQRVPDGFGSHVRNRCTAL